MFAGEGAIAATYDYSPYGPVVSTGDLVQPVQWSSEMNDVELALVYYKYRYYNPADGRWINRDPITAEGGWNLYEFMGNICVYKGYYLGLKDWKMCIRDSRSAGGSSGSPAPIRPPRPYWPAERRRSGSQRV